jgi:hypothetical protein
MMSGALESFDPAEFEDEAADRWGDTPQFVESQRRVATYGDADWQEIEAESSDIYRRFATLMRDGAAPASAEAQALTTEHRDHISRWFYDCTPEIHAGLGAMYVEDPRFTTSIDLYGAGLASYIRSAIDSDPADQP